VGARRLRSGLTTFKPLLEGDPELEALKAGFKWLGHACDRARGLDVFAGETLTPAEEGPSPPPGLAALREAIETARRTAWAEAAGAAASERFRFLMIDAVAWVETGAWRDAARAGEDVEPYARRALGKHLKKLAKRGRDAGGGDDVARHHLRIEAKKLRYAAEAFAGLFGEKRAARYLRCLKALQQTLGELNDLATAEPLLARLALGPDAAFAAGELVGRKAAGKDRLVAKAAKGLERLQAADRFWD
jgi:triphosphatase